MKNFVKELEWRGMIRQMMATAALCCMAMSMFTSCTNEDVPVPVSGNAVITVNTVALYDELNITDIMPKWLDGGTLYITDSVLIYDETGSLVTKLGAESSNMQPLTFEVSDLPNGTYTLVAWQSTRNGEKGSGPWIVYDEEQLSTVNIYTPYTGFFYTRALGVATATVTVDGDNIEANLSPKAMGSVIELRVDNMDEDSRYTGVTLRGENDQYIVGCRLDPSLADEDRWIFEREYNWYEIIGTMLKGTDSYKFFTLTHGDEVCFDLYGITEEDSLEWLLDGYGKLGVSENAFFYFDMSRSSYQPTYFGTYEGFTPWKADRDAGILVLDPYLGWGDNIDEVYKHINAKQWWDVGNYQLEFWEGMGWHRWYYIAYALTEQYLFETEDGENLITVLSICHDLTVPTDVVVTSLLKQGWTYSKLSAPDEEPFYFYLSPDGKTMASIYIYDDEWEVFYEPVYPEDVPYISPANEAPARAKVKNRSFAVSQKARTTFRHKEPKTVQYSPEVFE